MRDQVAKEHQYPISALCDIHSIWLQYTLYVIFGAECDVPIQMIVTGELVARYSVAWRKQRWHSLANTIVLAFKSVPHRFNSIKFLFRGFGIDLALAEEMIQRMKRERVGEVDLNIFACLGGYTQRGHHIG
jgi:hypothetical protein